MNYASTNKIDEDGASPGDPHIQKHLSTIEKLAFRSTNLIKQLITFARKIRLA